MLADFGRGICVPCKMMEPILDELKGEYKGKVEILIIEIDEYMAVTRKYKIRVIPTQIFFDKDGKEVYRHEGFMDKEAIKKKLKEMGVK
ncbi:MAG: thioredoxin family protein [bacterium]|nr:thioredoxin family protein [bacterium]